MEQNNSLADSLVGKVEVTDDLKLESVETATMAAAESVQAALETKLDPANLIEDKADDQSDPPATKVEIRITPATYANDTDTPPMMAFSMLSRRESNTLFDAINNIFATKDDRREAFTQDWLNALSISAKSTVPFSDYPAIRIREGGDWRQAPDDKRLGYFDVSKSERVVNGETLTGAKAIRAARVAIGGGAPQNLPLYQSGFWIAIKPPLEGDWNDLDETIMEQRKAFGWDHLGVAFSCYSTYLLATLLDFASRYITSCSVSIPEVKSGEITVGQWVAVNIDQMDILILLGYLTHATYPRGIPYVRPNPQHSALSTVVDVLDEKLSVYHCILHDFTRITEPMLDHMVKRGKEVMEISEVLKYQEMISDTRKDRIVKLNDNFSLVLAMPKFSDIVSSTDKWLIQMKSSLFNSLTKERSESEKQNYIQKNSKISSVRAYSAWIKELIIRIDGNDCYVRNREDIDAALLDMRNETRIAIESYNTILKYIADCAISQVAIPVDPNLQDMPESKDQDYPQRIVTLDIVALVFTLVEQLRKKLDV